jgi:hypothetical protein
MSEALFDRRVVGIWEAIGIALALQIAFILPLVAIREAFDLQASLPIWIANGIAGGLFPLVLTRLARKRRALAGQSKP